MQEGRIIEGRGGLYTAKGQDGKRHVLRARGIFRRRGISPLVGDLIKFSPGNPINQDEHGWVEEILPRTSQSLRPPVANISQLVIVMAPEPVPDLLLLDKLLILAHRQGILPVIAVNKSDLDASLASQLQADYQAAGVQVLQVSAQSGLGLEALKEAMQGHLTAYAGQSGAGKSTLISAITGMDLKTGAVSHRIRRGRQTTRHTSLLQVGGLSVLDTPGFSLLELPEDSAPELLRDDYPEYVKLAGFCRFQPCLHDTEPDCAVQAAVVQGNLSRNRWDRYRELLDQARQKWRNRYA